MKRIVLTHRVEFDNNWRVFSSTTDIDTLPTGHLVINHNVIPFMEDHYQSSTPVKVVFAPGYISVYTDTQEVQLKTIDQCCARDLSLLTGAYSNHFNR